MPAPTFVARQTAEQIRARIQARAGTNRKITQLIQDLRTMPQRQHEIAQGQLGTVRRFVNKGEGIGRQRVDAAPRQWRVSPETDRRIKQATKYEVVGGAIKITTKPSRNEHLRPVVPKGEVPYLWRPRLRKRERALIKKMFKLKFPGEAL